MLKLIKKYWIILLVFIITFLILVYLRSSTESFQDKNNEFLIVNSMELRNTADGLCNWYSTLGELTFPKQIDVVNWSASDVLDVYDTDIQDFNDFKMNIAGTKDNEWFRNNTVSDICVIVTGNKVSSSDIDYRGINSQYFDKSQYITASQQGKQQKDLFIYKKNVKY